MALLEVKQLRVRLHTRQGDADAVRGLSFALDRGQTLGIIGESGCGKSLSALALMALAPENSTVTGSIRFGGKQWLGQSERDWCAVRGNRIAMVFQEPMTALNPVHTIGHQVMEPLRLHCKLGRAQARARAIELLARVGIAQPGERLNAYPHQFSGGQRQRIMIAMALACGPDVLVADEPTTALDASVQRQVLDLIDQLVAENGMALILISHDLGLVAQSVSRMLVMYGGLVVEQGETAQIFAAPAHPYTRALMAARPTLAQRLASHPGARLPAIAGAVPDLLQMPPQGCPFASRCAFVQPACQGQNPIPPLVQLNATHSLRCHCPQTTRATPENPP
ncbi:MAG: ABC transporter ATP-binding protein [Burkholderiaceae bacterium]|jgi:peptide/nickel transport system ATP-binding protein|nr:ABC transporter ATP-binding protein [Burkholderiaceae bacterium]